MFVFRSTIFHNRLDLLKMKGQIMDKKIIILLSGFILAVILLTGCGNNEVASEYHIEYLNKENPLITLTGSCNDVLCSKCPNNKSQLCADNDKVASFDNACLKEYNLKIGDEIEWLALKDMAKSRIISQGKLSEVCKNCQWKCYDI